MTAHSVAELREAWRAIEAGEFAHGPRSTPAAPGAATVWTPAPGERVVAVLQPQTDRSVDPEALARFVKERIGSVKTPKQIEVWPDLPRSKVGKVLKTEIKAALASGDAPRPAAPR